MPDFGDRFWVYALVELFAERRDPVSAACVDRSFTVNTRAVALLMAEFARRHGARGAD